LFSTKSLSAQLQVISLSSEASASDELGQAILNPLQKYTQQVYAPIIKLSVAGDLVDFLFTY